MADAALAAGSWVASVRVVPVESVRAELVERAEAGLPTRSVWVTDLVDLRSAYWRATAPIAPTPERAEVLAGGRELHHVVEKALAAPRYLEVRTSREGIVGQIDLFEEHPTELKTTAPLPPLEGLASSRPGYFEQLGMYCALVDRPEARLILVDGHDPAAPAVAVLDCRYEPLSAILTAMRERAGRLRAALDRRDPAGLPGCPWFHRGCEFRSAGVCACTGEEPPGDRAIRDTLRSVEPRPDEAELLRSRLVEVLARDVDDSVRRFRDLLYPRRAYFERTRPLPEAAPAAPSPREGLYWFLTDLLESGPAGEVTRVPTLTGEPEESVGCFRGDPYLLRTSRAWEVIPTAQLATRSPQYLLDLGLRCAALERSGGWLIVGYERAPAWGDRLRVYRVDFDPFLPIAEMARERSRALRTAIADRDPSHLPTCPGWMYDGCPYAPGCGCGGAAARS